MSRITKQKRLGEECSNHLKIEKLYNIKKKLMNPRTSSTNQTEIGGQSRESGQAMLRNRLANQATFTKQKHSDSEGSIPKIGTGYAPEYPAVDLDYVHTF